MPWISQGRRNKLLLRSRVGRLQPTLVDRRDRGWRCQKFNERFGSARFLRSHGDPGSEHGDFLKFRGERPNKIDAMNGKQLADLLKSDLGFAASDHVADPLTFDLSALGPELVGNPEALKQLG